MDPPREKHTKNQDDPCASSSQKSRKKIVLVKHLTPQADISDDEPDLPLEMHKLLEKDMRNFLNYPNMDLATIMAKWQEECYDSRKVSPDPRFWTLFYADWY
jgi:hypothetical protein